VDTAVVGLDGGIGDAQLWLVPVVQDIGLGEIAAVIDRIAPGALAQLVDAAVVRRLGGRDVIGIPHPGGDPLRLVLVGLGRGGQVDGYLLRNLVELGLRGSRVSRAAILLDRSTLGALRATRELGAAATIRLALEGAVRACGAWGRPGEGDTARCERIVVATDAIGPDARAEVAADARLLGETASRVRAWQWAPANQLTPARFADEAVRLGSAAGLEVTVLDQAALRRDGYGGILGVAQGSAEPPRLVLLRHRGRGAGPVLGLVGKGVTFDAGGMALKPQKDLHLMKTDMSAAAAVLGALLVTAAWRPAIDVVGVLPLAENVLGTGSLHPGDVITLAGGIDVEVINPDAEGRLLLGDGLVHARRAGATHLVSVGTLTDAVSVAQGPTVSGMVGEDAAFLGRVEAAAQRAGERLLALTMYPEYDRVLDSDVASVCNEADDLHEEPVAAAIFLRRFVGGTPWAHLDIGGSSSNEHENLYQVVPRGPSAVATGTLAELAREMAAGVSGAP